MEMSSITAISLMHSQDIDLLGNIIVKLINIKLYDLLACCHFILNPSRRCLRQVSLGLKGVQKGTQVLKLNKGLIFIENQCLSMCADLLPRN